MFGLGMWEILIILGIALIFIGPSKLPEIAQMLGKGLREFRRATNDIKSAADLDAPFRDVTPSDPPKAALPEPETQENSKDEPSKAEPAASDSSAPDSTASAQHTPEAVTQTSESEGPVEKEQSEKSGS